MQASTVSPVTNTTVTSNTTAITKSKEQILIQSGAMIAVIVIGIIIILAILLIILKTYNMGISSVSGSITNSNPASESSFRLPRAELTSAEGNQVEQFSTNSGSTVVTIHENPSIENT
uniref:Si:dkey-221l4.10 n=1 Tax=Maylandia zebra TaxID=106582 RepID=A0A3P9B7P3_9CICH